MSKNFLSMALSLFIALILMNSTATAGFIGNPVATQKQGTFQANMEIDFTKRDMKSDELDDEDEVNSNRYMMKGVYGFTDALNAFFKVGMVSSEFDYFVLDIETDPEVSFGAGAKVTFQDNGKSKFGATLQVLRWTGEETVSETYFDGYYIYYFNADTEIEATEIDIAIGGCHTVNDKTTLYGGFVYSMVDGEFKIDEADYKDDIEEDSSIGIFAGLDLNFNRNAHAGLELRMIAEESFSFLLGFAF